jgi:8-oxo-dGTP diphosphatase
MNSLLGETFGHRVRVRVCGISVIGDRILLIGHRGLVQDALYWSPPGGGVQFGERTRDALIREVREETGLTARVGSFMFYKEFIAPPLHAIEMYYLIENQEMPPLDLGSDPELPLQSQSIEELRQVTLSEIQKLPLNCVDSIFHNLPSLDYLCDRRNWPTIQNELI